MFPYRLIHCHFDKEEAMVALVKTLSPLQTAEVEHTQETSSRYHKMVWYFEKQRSFKNSVIEIN